MTKKERALLAVQTLEEVYPQATCALQYEKPYELLIAVRLSAQCTDARVNQITPKLFAAYPTLESLAAADIADLEDIVRPCGFFHMKAKSIKEMSAQLILNFGGVVPDNMEDLLSLSGVVFGAGQNDQIRRAQLPHGLHVPHTQKRVLFQRHKIGKIGNMRQFQNSCAPWRWR